MPMKALIIDPSRSYRQLLTNIMSNYGFDAYDAGDLSSAKSILKQHRFQLICLAMDIPGGSSIEFCMRLRAQEETFHTPVLMLTSSSDKQAIHRALRAGVTDIFHKQNFNLFDRHISNIALNLQQSKKPSGRILYVEDTLSVAKSTIALLEKHGYSIDHFTNAEDAIAAFNEHEYALVFTDIVLESQLSGLAVVSAVREYEQTDKALTPVLAMSAYNDNSRKLALFRAGANDYVPRPIFNEELLARVNNLVTNHNLIKQLKAQQKHMEQLAMTDQLTGLHNRHYLMDIAPKRIKQCQDNGFALSLLMMDLDNFKSINDQYGHIIGDQVLSETASMLSSLTQLNDITARVGGEEFVLLLDHCDLPSAQTKAEKIRQSMERLKPAKVSITASFGLTAVHKGEFDFASVFSRADAALYDAKEDGRNKVVVFS